MFSVLSPVQTQEFEKTDLWQAKVQSFLIKVYAFIIHEAPQGGSGNCRLPRTAAYVTIDITELMRQAV